MPNSELKSQSILLKINCSATVTHTFSPDTYTLMSRRQEKVNAIRRPEVGGGWRIQVGAQIGYSTQGLFLPYINIFANRSVSGGCIGTVHTVAVRSYFSPVTYEYVPYHSLLHLERDNLRVRTCVESRFFLLQTSDTSLTW